jgi:hypothetical protein
MTVTIIALLGLWILTGALPGYYGYTPDEWDTLGRNAQLGVVLAFSQVYGGFAALFAAGVVGYFALILFSRDVAEAIIQFGPRALDGDWPSGAAECSLRARPWKWLEGGSWTHLGPNDGTGPIRVPMGVLNVGDGMAGVWHVELDDTAAQASGIGFHPLSFPGTDQAALVPSAARRVEDLRVWVSDPGRFTEDRRVDVRVPIFIYSDRSHGRKDHFRLIVTVRVTQPQDYGASGSGA